MYAKSDGDWSTRFYFFQESKTFRFYKSSPIFLKFCQTKDNLMIIIFANFVATGLTRFTVSKGQRLSDIFILVRFPRKFVRIKLISCSLYVHILVPIAQRDSTVFKSQRLSGFEKNLDSFLKLCQKIDHASLFRL